MTSRVGPYRSLFAACALAPAFAAACGGSPAVPSPQVPESAPAPSAQHAAHDGGAPLVASLAPAPDPSLASVRLRFELDGRPFPVPLVRGSVAGEPTWMLVDTGSTGHTVAGWLARKAHLSTKGGESGVGVDHAGRSIATSRVDHVDLRIDGWNASLGDHVLVTEIPEAIEQLGIGAFISPQHLAKEGETLVLDLAHEEMHLLPNDRARRELGAFAGASLFGAPPRMCTDGEADRPGTAFVLAASVDGTKASLLLDTGSHRSDLLSGSAGGKKLFGRSVPGKEAVYAAGGKVATRMLPGAKLTAGELARQVDLDMMPGGSGESDCPRDGVVGMDVLKRCVLFLEPTHVAGRCAP